MVPLLKNKKVFNDDIFEDLDDTEEEKIEEEEDILHSSSIYEDIDEYE